MNTLPKRMLISFAINLMVIDSIRSTVVKDCATVVIAAIDDIAVKSSAEGDYRTFVVAVTKRNRMSGSTPSMPIIVLMDGDESFEDVADEVARNLALWSGYALVLNVSQVMPQM
jgi:predicted TIM-barrel enzyme